MKTIKKSRSVKTSILSSRQKEREALDLVPALLSIREILVPVDFSGHSRKALKYAATFARQFGAHVTLLHVLEMPVITDEFVDLGSLSNMMESSQKRARVEMEEWCKGDFGSGFLRPFMLKEGAPWREIVAAAGETNADLIILGTHGRTGLKHVFMGSTAERVVRHAQCPVLVVRQCEHDFV